MRIRSLILAGFLLCGHLSFAQGDGCRGALSALVRVKEQITPTLNASTESGRERLSVMLSTLKNATNLCKEFPDLWYYRTVIARQLGKPDAYAEKKLQELSYVAQYDPFKLPQAAEEPEKQESPTHVRKKWALVIGIDQYQDERVPRLNFAVKDSQDFEEFLKDPEGGRFDPANIIHLVDQKATLTGIRQALGKLRAQVQKDDLVVLYFSGHGSPREMDPNGMSYIITNDTSLDGPENLYATSLQMIDLVQQVNRDIKARRVVLFLDTCYSGDAQRVDDEEAGSARGIDGIQPGIQQSNGRLWPGRPHRQPGRRAIVGESGMEERVLHSLPHQPASAESRKREPGRPLSPGAGRCILTGPP
jgi:hypothetical protein